MDKTKARAAESPAFYYSGGISDVNNDDDDDGVDDSNADENRSYNISAVHFMPRIVTHARELRGSTDIPRTLYNLRNINIFLLPMTHRRYATRFVSPPRAFLARSCLRVCVSREIINATISHTVYRYLPTLEP